MALGRAGLFLDIDGYNPTAELASLLILHQFRNHVNYHSFLNEWGYEPCP